MSASARIKAALAEQWSRPEAASVVVRLPRPPSVNKLWTVGRGGGIKCTPRYASWKVVAGTAINAQRPGRIVGPFALTLLVSTSSKADLDNHIKATLDSLQTARVIENDKLLRRLVVEWSDQIDGVEATLFPWRG